MACVQLGVELCVDGSATEVASRREVHSKLLGTLSEVVAATRTSPRDVAAAARAMGELAAPTLKFFGQQVRLRPRLFWLRRSAALTDLAAAARAMGELAVPTLKFFGQRVSNLRACPLLVA